MKNNKIKISQEQWLASGIRKGYVIAEDDGSFTLKKEAFAPLLRAAPALSRAFYSGAKALWSSGAVKSALVGMGLGSITNLFGRSGMKEAVQDWWQGGSETPEMLKALTDARDRFQQEVKSNLMGISDRLDSDLLRIEAKLNERIQTFSQRLAEKGMGPAYDQGKKLVQEEKDMLDMIEGAQQVPANPSAISGKIKDTKPAPASPAANPSVSSAPAAATAPAAAKTPSPTKPSKGGGSALENAIGTT